MKYMDRSIRQLVVIAAISCAGCTALETKESKAWLALHAVDTVQTLELAHDTRCYVERDGLTRRLIGSHPSDGEVAAWALGSAALQLGVTELLLRTDHPRAAAVWQYMRIGITASAVAENHSIGISIGSQNKPSTGPCAPEPQLFQPAARPIK